MTYCVGINLNMGLVLLADTCISSGAHLTYAHKLYTFYDTNKCLFIASSGLRSVRDKTITYFDEMMREHNLEHKKLYQVVNSYCKCLRQVAAEDKKALKEENYKFDTHALIGGQFVNDQKAELFLVFPEGNWVKINENSECFGSIGSTDTGQSYLKTILNRQLSIEMALKTAIYAFDKTVHNIATVDYPLDVIIYENDSFVLQQHQLQAADCAPLVASVDDRIREDLRKSKFSIRHVSDNQ